MTTPRTGDVQAIHPSPDLDKLAEIFVAAFPELDADGQRLAQCGAFLHSSAYLTECLLN